jgi:cytoskeletal protein CcmA (bactofilin family)
MMWKPEKTDKTADEAFTENKSDSTRAESKLGKSIVIKGEVSGSEPLFIDGRVEGLITMAGGRVTVGNGARIAGNISAREVAIFGQVQGNLAVDDRVQIHAEGSLLGDVTAQRLLIDDGAYLKGSVDLRKPANRSLPERRPAPADVPSSAALARVKPGSPS